MHSPQLSQYVRRRVIWATVQSSRLWDFRPSPGLKGYCWRRWYAELQEAVLVTDVTQTLLIFTFPCSSFFTSLAFRIMFPFSLSLSFSGQMFITVAFRESNIGDFAKRRSVIVCFRCRIIRTTAAPGSDPFNRCSVALINYCGNNGRSRRQGHVFISSLVRSPCIEIRKHCLSGAQDRFCDVDIWTSVCLLQFDQVQRENSFSATVSVATTAAHPKP